MTELKNTMSDKAKFFRYLALGGHLGLLSWMCLWYLVIGTKFEYSTVFILIVYILPLVLPLPGVIAAKPYTHAWACFIVLLYFLHAITVLYAEPDYRWHASLELVLASIMFTGCSMFARLRGAELGTSLKKLSTVMQEEKDYFEGKKDNK